jgi:RNA polymerase sigma-70 factor (ECF subfamily)
MGLTPEQLSACFVAHGDFLVLYARQWVDADTARDLVQDAFVGLMHRRRTPDNLKGFLVRCVRNAAFNELRSSRRRQRCGEALSRRREQWFEPPSGDRVDAQAAQQALAQLDEAQREAVVLRIWGGMTLAEIAGVTGEAISTVHARYESALGQIRRRMTQPCQTDTK